MAIPLEANERKYVFVICICVFICFYFNGNLLDRVYVNINNSDRSGNVFILK